MIEKSTRTDKINSMNPKEFTKGSQLKKYRESKGKTQENYARFLEYTVRGYQKIELEDLVLSERMKNVLRRKFRNDSTKS